MKRKAFISFMICSLAFFITGCVVHIDGNNTMISGQKMLIGNGVRGEKVRDVTDFEAIDVRGSIDVTISGQKDAPVKVSGDENLIDFVETSVKGGVLNVHFKDGYGYKSKNGLRVTVPGNGRINRIKASGSSDVTIEGCLTADQISISGKGRSDVKGNIKAGDCTLNFSGNADYKGNIEAGTCTLSFSGNSDCKGNIEAANCRISCSGSTECIISGSADVCDVSMSGSCDFKGYDFVVKKFTSSASGSSDVQITCTEELRIKARGSSDVFYRGSGKVMSVQTSGSSGLHFR